MAIDYARLRNWPLADVEHTYDWKASALYALGVGYGHDPMDERQLRFVYEEDMVAAPTMPVVLATHGFWVKEQNTGVDWVKVLHGEQSLTIHRPIPAAATVIGSTRVKGIVDKGRDKGAILVQERMLHDKATGELLATLEQLSFCRGDGGFSEQPGNGPRGGDPAPTPKPATPDSPPDLACDLPTLPQAALIYRLCADQNPLHADPKVARAAGFPRPILHGLASFGVAGHAIIKTCCDYDPARLKSIGLRFSGPVFPGETLRTEMWRQGNRIQFRARSVERDVVVLSHGVAEIA
ncbi:MaoC/PaaZ C-terminal domain-containing protein [Quisquiliibacterium transsilvanicum]|uniref:Acyl dehydratase n=1 Tax=Quisquiliibacterium transsilvanicum TaxID=1549638 RepID=A0A7W8HKU3_9BURK|nr:MaoC/PaaZ C-terminal domain-containing protein [Quisquiliibacterium transsilvanicum]MBB5272955.1 acyl dehydratase [Quisquiliibacterium transsilvanicum]